MSCSFNQDMGGGGKKETVETILLSNSEQTPHKRETKEKEKYPLVKYRTRDACQRKA